MPKRKIRTLAVTGITFVAATLLTLAAAGASATTASAAPGHALGTANTVAQAAQAATARGNMQAQSVPAGYFRLQNAHSGYCIDEYATTGTIALDNCNTTHTQYWAQTYNGGPLVNLHSGKCLQVDGYSTTVPISAANCDGDTSQGWYYGTGDYGYLLANAHSGLCLQGQGALLYQGGGTLCANDSGVTIFNWHLLT